MFINVFASVCNEIDGMLSEAYIPDNDIVTAVDKPNLRNTENTEPAVSSGPFDVEIYLGTTPVQLGSVKIIDEFNNNVKAYEILIKESTSDEEFTTYRNTVNLLLYVDTKEDRGSS